MILSSEVAKNALSVISKGYLYFFGGKGWILTNDSIKYIVRKYPDVFTDEIIEISKTKIGKYVIDCSGFVSVCTNTNYGNSFDIFNHSLSTPLKEVRFVKDGSIVWSKGHIGLIIFSNGEWLIAEARDSRHNLTTSKIFDRLSHFTHVGELNGVDYNGAKILEL